MDNKRCPLCNGKIIIETESNMAEYVCKDCDLLMDISDNIIHPRSDIIFYLANYGTMKNIEIFDNFEDAKTESSNNKVYKALLNPDNVWFEENLGWNYEDNSDLFLYEPILVEN